MRAAVLALLIAGGLIAADVRADVPVRKLWICQQSSSIDGEFIRQRHYHIGAMYGIVLTTGRLVPPGEKGEPDITEMHWMCRWHIAEWLGYDPVTKLRVAGLFQCKHGADCLVTTAQLAR